MMIKRRSFLKSSTTGIFGSSLMMMPSFLHASNPGAVSIVKQPEEAETYFVRENTPITIYISKHVDNLSSLSICSEALPPGGGIPTHKHLYADEYFYFISGEGVITAAEKEFPFKKGTTAFVPQNTWHKLKSTGTDPVIFQFGYSPSGFEDFFRQIGTPQGQMFRKKPKEEFDHIAEKFGIVFQ